MKTLLILIALLPVLATVANAAKVGTIQTQLDGYKCRARINKLSSQWQAKNDWKGHIGKDGAIILKRPTQKFAHWIVLEKSGTNEIISLMNPTRANRVEFDTKCKSKLTSFNHNHYSNPKGFNDHGLLQEMMANKSGIIVMWSPGMGHSFTAIERLQKISQETNLPLTYIMDPFADETLATKELEKKKLKNVIVKKLSSLELFYRDATMHYPSFFIYKNGEIISNNIAGLMTEHSYKTALTKYLGEKK